MKFNGRGLELNILISTTYVEVSIIPLFICAAEHQQARRVHSPIKETAFAYIQHNQHHYIIWQQK
jgi:hypothetical protein